MYGACRAGTSAVALWYSGGLHPPYDCVSPPATCNGNSPRRTQGTASARIQIRGCELKRPEISDLAGRSHDGIVGDATSRCRERNGFGAPMRARGRSQQMPTASTMICPGRDRSGRFSRFRLLLKTPWRLDIVSEQSDWVAAEAVFGVLCVLCGENAATAGRHVRRRAAPISYRLRPSSLHVVDHGLRARIKRGCRRTAADEVTLDVLAKRHQ